jgi:hypothetical protein
MTPWQQAFNWATAHGITPEEWERKIEACLQAGWVISTPEEFVAAHPAEHNGEPAYFVFMACGGSGHPLHRFLRYAPRPVPWVLWHRRNEKRLRAFRWDQLAKKARI